MFRHNIPFFVSRPIHIHIVSLPFHFHFDLASGLMASAYFIIQRKLETIEQMKPPLLSPLSSPAGGCWVGAACSALSCQAFIFCGLEWLCLLTRCSVLRLLVPLNNNNNKHTVGTHSEWGLTGHGEEDEHHILFSSL